MIFISGASQYPTTPCGICLHSMTTDMAVNHQRAIAFWLKIVIWIDGWWSDSRIFFIVFIHVDVCRTKSGCQNNVYDLEWLGRWGYLMIRHDRPSQNLCSDASFAAEQFSLRLLIGLWDEFEFSRHVPVFIYCYVSSVVWYLPPIKYPPLAGLEGKAKQLSRDKETRGAR